MIEPADGYTAEWDVLICPACWAAISADHLADHDRWHEEEAERVEAAILKRKRLAGIRPERTVKQAARLAEARKEDP